MVTCVLVLAGKGASTGELKFENNKNKKEVFFSFRGGGSGGVGLFGWCVGCHGLDRSHSQGMWSCRPRFKSRRRHVFFEACFFEMAN